MHKQEYDKISNNYCSKFIDIPQELCKAVIKANAVILMTKYFNKVLVSV